jgi:hypothetical protein
MHNFIPWNLKTSIPQNLETLKTLYIDFKKTQNLNL